MIFHGYRHYQHSACVMLMIISTLHVTTARGITTGQALPIMLSITNNADEYRNPNPTQNILWVSATYGTLMTLDNNTQRFVFKTVPSDQTSYNTDTGEFTAPVNGTYTINGIIAYYDHSEDQKDTFKLLTGTTEITAGVAFETRQLHNVRLTATIDLLQDQKITLAFTGTPNSIDICPKMSSLTIDQQ